MSETLCGYCLEPTMTLLDSTKLSDYYICDCGTKLCHTYSHTKKHIGVKEYWYFPHRKKNNPWVIYDNRFSRRSWIERERND